MKNKNIINIMAFRLSIVLCALLLLSITCIMQMHATNKIREDILARSCDIAVSNVVTMTYAMRSNTDHAENMMNMYKGRHRGIYTYAAAVHQFGTWCIRDVRKDCRYENITELNNILNEKVVKLNRMITIVEVLKPQ